MENDYKSEQEFLAHYDSSGFKKISATVDILVFSVSSSPQDNYRKLNNKHFSVLLVKRDRYPFKDMWCLPGGFIDYDETSEAASKRILKRETNIKNIYLEQLYTFDALDRDPRMRIISISYMALIDCNRLDDKVLAKASWFNLEMEENDDRIIMKFDNGQENFEVVVKKSLKELTTDRYKYTVTKNDHLAFDHALTIACGVSRLKNKIEYTDIVFNMMPEYFTLGELQQVYEVILGKKLLDPAFRRVIASKVVATDKVRVDGGHRPSKLFKYKGHTDE